MVKTNKEYHELQKSDRKLRAMGSQARRASGRAPAAPAAPATAAAPGGSVAANRNARADQAVAAYDQAAQDFAHRGGTPQSTTQDYRLGLQQFGARTKKDQFNRIKAHQSRLNRGRGGGWNNLTRAAQDEIAARAGYSSPEAYYEGGLPVMNRAQAGSDRQGGRYYNPVDPKQIQAAEEAIKMADTHEKRRASIAAARMVKGARDSAALKMWFDMDDRNALPSTPMERQQAATMQNRANQIAFENDTKNFTEAELNEEARIVAASIPVEEHYPPEGMARNPAWQRSYDRFMQLQGDMGDGAPNAQIYRLMQTELKRAQMYAAKYASNLSNQVRQLDSVMNNLPKEEADKHMAAMEAHHPDVVREWRNQQGGQTLVSSYAHRQKQQQLARKELGTISTEAGKLAKMYPDAALLTSTEDPEAAKAAKARIAPEIVNRDRENFVKLRGAYSSLPKAHLYEIFDNAFRMQTGQEVQLPQAGTPKVKQSDTQKDPRGPQSGMATLKQIAGRQALQEAPSNEEEDDSWALPTKEERDRAEALNKIPYAERARKLQEKNKREVDKMMGNDNKKKADIEAVKKMVEDSKDRARKMKARYDKLKGK